MRMGGSIPLSVREWKRRWVRFGPLVGGRRAVLGGLVARRPGGTIAWRAAGEQASVEVEGFAPLLRGPFWQLEQVVPRSSRQAVPGTGRTRGPLGCVSLS